MIIAELNKFIRNTGANKLKNTSYIIIYDYKATNSLFNLPIIEYIIIIYKIYIQ